MNTITVPAKDQVNQESQAIFFGIEKSLGKVPNLYATLGYSSIALKAYLSMEEQLSKGVFSHEQREAISLIVSEVNNCKYCVSAHTLIATMKGYSPQEILNIRKGNATDPKIQAIVNLAKEITLNKGKVNEKNLQSFFDAGFGNDAVMELLGLVASRIFTNYTYALTEIPNDFPEAVAI